MDGRCVRRDVDFTQDVEEVHLFKAAGGCDCVEEGFEGWELGDEALDDFAESFEDAVVVDGSRVECDRGVF